jgi:hypothetical protein
MVRVGQRVMIRKTGEKGRVLRVISIVKGVVLKRPLAIIRLDTSDEFDVTMTTAFADELEDEEPAEGRVGA